MSDAPQGLGWFEAVDGKWYPPERHPDYRPPQPPGTDAATAQATAGGPAGAESTAPQAYSFPPTGATTQTSTSPFAPAPDTATPNSLEHMGFFRSLYDFSFSSFITLRLIRIIYVVLTIVYTLGAVIAFIGALIAHQPIDIVFAIIVVPLVYFVYLMLARVVLEVVMVLFNIGKDVRAIRERGGSVVDHSQLAG